MFYSNGYGFNFQSFLRTMSPAYTTFCRRVAKVNCDEARGADVELDLSNDGTNPLAVTLLPALAAIVHRHSLTRHPGLVSAFQAHPDPADSGDHLSGQPGEPAFSYTHLSFRISVLKYRCKTELVPCMVASLISCRLKYSCRRWLFCAGAAVQVHLPDARLQRRPWCRTLNYFLVTFWNTMSSTPA